MYFGDYFDNPNITEIEKSLSKDNFKTKMEEAYRLHFDSEPHPDVFTGYKFFNKEPFTNVQLMEQGLHVFRMIFARHAGKIREEGYDWFDDGIGVMHFEDYCDNEFVNKIRKEIDLLPISENKQPFNTVQALEAQDYPSIVQLVKESDIFDRCCKSVRRSTESIDAQEYYLNTTFVQRVDNSPTDGDIQKVCHSDIFFPAVKFWYFPYDVNEDDGPFMYGEHSPTLTHRIIDFHYRESVNVVKGTWDREKRNKGHGEGSFRALPADLEDMGVELKAQPVKANSLVIANVSGFHCRGNTKFRSVRSSVHGAIRLEDCFAT